MFSNVNVNPLTHVIKVLSDDRLKIRPHVSDSANESFLRGKLRRRNDRHGVFKSALMV